MSKPHPIIAIEMFNEMLKRIESGEIKFFIGDSVEINDVIDKDVFQATIKYPYCYDIDGEQSYCIEEYAVPYKSSDIQLLSSAKNSKERTIQFFKYWITKSETELVEGTWVAP